MSTADYLNLFLEPVTAAFTPEIARVFADLPPRADLQSLVDDLAKKANDGTLTPAEEAKYKSIVDAADVIAILQLKARRFLKDHPG